jgi:heme/copper-type cytochrome/quinol oxidase subunit 1
MLHQFKNKPHFFLMAFIVLYLLLGIYCNTSKTLDINIHDTYYVIQNKHLYFLISISLIIFYLFYLLFPFFKLRLFLNFKKIHIYTTLISCVGFTFPYHYFYNEKDLFPPTLDRLFFITFFAVLLVLSLFVFLLNILICIFKILNAKYNKPAL